MIEALYTTNHLQTDKFLLLFIILFAVIFLRYFLLSAVFHYSFRIALQKTIGNRRIVEIPLKKEQAYREIFYSSLSALIFALISVFMIVGWQKGYVKIYMRVNSDFPLWYIPISLLLILFLHDTYYYWLHRLIHHKSVYKKIHKVHHDSIDTSSYTSFSFHPLESVAQALIIPILLLVIPLHIYAFLGLLVFMTVSAIINHLGVEVYPSGRLGRWFAKWIIGATHHDQHHRNFKVNYGLYFTFWDRWMNTESKHFRKQFDKNIS